MLYALSRSLVRLLTRSLAASGFKISAAVVDVRCPRSDRGPGTSWSRLRSIDRSVSAESSKCPPPRSSGKPPRRGVQCAHVPAQSSGRTQFRYPPIDRSIESRFTAIKFSAFPAKKRGRVSDIEVGNGDENTDGNTVPGSLSIDRQPDRFGDGCSHKRSPTRFRSGIDRSVYVRTRWSAVCE